MTSYEDATTGHSRSSGSQVHFLEAQSAQAPPARLLPGPVLILGPRLRQRLRLAQVAEGLGLSVVSCSSLEAARRALSDNRCPVAIVDLPVLGLSRAADLKPGSGPMPTLLTVGHGALEGVQAIAEPLEQTLGAALHHLRTPPVSATPSRLEPPTEPQGLPRGLIIELLSKPGVLGVTLLERDGQIVSEEGEGVPHHLSRILIQALDAAALLIEDVQGEALRSVQLEYDRRTLLLAAVGTQVMACVLGDAGTGSLVRYLLRVRLAA